MPGSALLYVSLTGNCAAMVSARWQYGHKCISPLLSMSCWISCLPPILFVTVMLGCVWPVSWCFHFHQSVVCEYYCLSLVLSIFWWFCVGLCILFHHSGRLPVFFWSFRVQLVIIPCSVLRYSCILEALC